MITMAKTLFKQSKNVFINVQNTIKVKFVHVVFQINQISDFTLKFHNILLIEAKYL